MVETDFNFWTSLNPKDFRPSETETFCLATRPGKRFALGAVKFLHNIWVRCSWLAGGPLVQYKTSIGNWNAESYLAADKTHTGQKLINKPAWIEIQTK